MRKQTDLGTNSEQLDRLPKRSHGSPSPYIGATVSLGTSIRINSHLAYLVHINSTISYKYSEGSFVRMVLSPKFM